VKVRTIPAALLVVAVLCAACGQAISSGGSAGAPVSSSTPPARSVELPPVSGAKAVVARLCALLTPQLQAAVARGFNLPASGCAQMIGIDFHGTTDNGPLFEHLSATPWVKIQRDGAFVGVEKKVIMQTSQSHGSPAWIEFWLGSSDKKQWQVAKMGDLDRMVDAGYPSIAASEPPTQPGDVTTPSTVPAPAFSCSGSATSIADPAGDEGAGDSRLAPWMRPVTSIDIRKVTLVGGPHPCLQITFAQPVRPDTDIGISSTGQNIQGQVAEIWFGSGRNFDYWGLATPTGTAKVSYGETGSTVVLALDPKQPLTLATLGVCAVSTQSQEPYLTHPEVGSDAAPNADSDEFCWSGP
jgi:hypothetical protein